MRLGLPNPRILGNPPRIGLDYGMFADVLQADVPASTPASEKVAEIRRASHPISLESRSTGRTWPERPAERQI